MSCRFRRMTLRRFFVTVFVLAAFACAWPGHALTQSSAEAHANSHQATHLYVLLGFGNMSPGLGVFGANMKKRGIPTTVSSHSEWRELSQEAIAQYKSGRLRSIMIVGHSFGGGAARAMAGKLGEAGVPVKLLVTLAPWTDLKVPSNVERSINILPGPGENHYSVIAAHMRELTRYVLRTTGRSEVSPDARARHATQ
jgi:pimeloyl-ACP methyl ester carboxylesterase